MDKSRRLDTIQKLVKLQEQMVLVELRELQQESDALKNQINHLVGIKNESNSKLATQTLYVNELMTAKVFSQSVEQVISATQSNLQVTDNNYAIVGERIKELRTSLISINRLVEKYQILYANELSLAEQRQTEEFLGYTQIPQD